MKSIPIGLAALCAVGCTSVSAEDVQGQARSNVRIEVTKADADYVGPVGSIRKREPSTTGSGALGSTTVAAAGIECQLITVRSPQPNGTTLVRRLRNCD